MRDYELTVRFRAADDADANIFVGVLMGLNSSDIFPDGIAVVKDLLVLSLRVREWAQVWKDTDIAETLRLALPTTPTPAKDV
jgi:hypothetical protein